MQVILIQDVDNLGGTNELVTVKNGYARNFLIPQKKAVEANSSNLKQMQEKQKQLAKKEAKLLSEINSVIAVLKESPLKNWCKNRYKRQDFRKCYFPSDQPCYSRPKRIRNRP